MTDLRPSLAIQPNRGIGWITLGASLHAILTRLKSQPQFYPQIDLAYSASEPIADPIILTLNANGLRLRFDGPDQRLRLVEIIDFSKTTFTYKNTELVRRQGTSTDDIGSSVSGPSFKHLYNRLFGPSYPGEYLPPSSTDSKGVYVLSWPGLAAKFSLRDNSWSEKADFVSLLSSTAASPATSLAVFSGSSWSEVRDTLYTQRPLLPRSLIHAARPAENTPDEVEEVVIRDSGRVELLRRTSPPLTITLHEDTPQDLVAELGPPDAIFRKSASGLSIHAGGISSKNRQHSTSSNVDCHSHDQDHSSNRSYTDESENEASNVDDSHDEEASEQFYNYFHHGFDVLISSPTKSTIKGRSADGAEFVATKIFLHGNIPGSYSFNRHRRCRWRIELDDNGHPLSLTSEMKFCEVSDVLKDIHHHTYKNDEDRKRMQRGMMLNRGWGVDSPESSIELLGGFEEGVGSRDNSRTGTGGIIPSMDNTELFGFPGLLFEVLKNDMISCLTVYRPE